MENNNNNNSKKDEQSKTIAEFQNKLDKINGMCDVVGQESDKVILRSTICLIKKEINECKTALSKLDTENMLNLSSDKLEEDMIGISGHLIILSTMNRILKFIKSFKESI